MRVFSITNVLALAATALAGKATYYYQNGNAGSCGEYNPDSAYLVAVSPSAPHFDTRCGRMVKIRNVGGGHGNKGVGKTIVARVVDTCPECPGDHLDLSVGAFQDLTGGLDPPGAVNIKWWYI